MYKTDQEKFWAEEFGSNYMSRNDSDKLFSAKVNMWSKIIKCTSDVKSIKELGCNIGLNLKSLNLLNSEFSLSGVEINKDAAEAAQKMGVADIEVGSILDDKTEKKADLVFTAGVLIHINPDYLDSVYKNLVEGSNKYIVVAEYYNPSPVSISYRGHKEKLFKRDFAGDLIDKYGLKLVDYGFEYRRDNYFPQDDITWFLLEK